jgi:cytochrome c-type biogenesis protein
VTGGAPLTIAFVAGGLSTLNPCGFPLLPAFLSFYVGADEERLPRAPNRAIQGLLVGLAVTVGYLGVFALVGLPITYGATEVAHALPWLGIAIGISLAAAGSLLLGGRSLSFSVRLPLRLDDQRRLSSMLVFGIAYGVASLGCALPLFLALVGSSLGAEGAGAIVVFLAFSVGTASMLMALSLAAALAREGLAQRLRLLLPYVSRLAGALLLLAGAYVAYYWARLSSTVSSGPTATD